MTAKRVPNGARDEAGLASVLGAILLFGLLVSTMVTVQVQYVPVWDHDREGRLMDALAGQLVQVKDGLEKQVGNRSIGAASTALLLAPGGGFTFFTGSTQPGTVAFVPTPAGSGLEVESNRLTVLHQDGRDLFVLSEDWRPLANGQTVSGIDSVDHLRVRLIKPESLTNKQALQLVVRDADSAIVGRLAVTNQDQGAEYALLIQTYAGAQTSTPMTERLQSWKKTLDGDRFYVDALEPALGLDAVLRTAKEPLSLQWTLTNNLQGAEAALVYTSAAAGRIGAAGVVVQDYSHLVDGGRLVATRENQRFPAQTYTMEYGAIIVDQPEGSAMLTPPTFSVRTASGQTTVTWTVPELVGSSGSVGGTRAAQVASTPLGPRMSLQASAPRLTFTIDTEHSQVWTAYWDTVLQDAGLRSTGSQPQYRVVAAGHFARLEIFGLTPNPADTTVNDLFLDYQEATLSLALLPTGG